jgi:hypothetical protein
MYTVRIVHHPAPGKVPELRAVLEEHARAMNAGGHSHNVSELLYTEEPGFVNAIRYDSLAAVEAYPLLRAKDSAWQARTQRITSCLSRPQVQSLYENLIMPNPTGEVNYALQRTFYPAPGKAAELRAAIEQRAKTLGPGAVGKGVSAQVLGPDRPHFVLTTLFSNLDGYEQYLKAQPNDPGVQAYAAQVMALTTPDVGTQQLSRVLVRFGQK